MSNHEKMFQGAGDSFRQILMRKIRSAVTASRAVAGLPQRMRWMHGDVGEIRLRQIYQLIGELRRRNLEGPSDCIDLRTAELRIFSQNGEDGVLDAILRHIGDSPHFFVEFGAEDGGECNTRLLAETFGWSGVYFEPSPKAFLRLVRRYRFTDRIQAADEAITPENVNHLFRREGVPSRFGVLSIDIDGQDYWVWKALSDEYRPDVVVIECNMAYPPGQQAVETEGHPHDPVFEDSFGASLAALEALGRSKGYDLVHVDMAGINAFFVAHDVGTGSSGTFLGVTDRSANFLLRGYGHPTLTPRAVIDPSALTEGSADH